MMNTSLAGSQNQMEDSAPSVERAIEKDKVVLGLHEVTW